MPAQILTTEDLYDFKIELLNEIRNIIVGQQPQSAKKWLKSTEVRRMLNISPGTLQTLRLNGTLPCTKIGGTIYYSTTDIENILSKNQNPKKQKPPLLFP
jgi:hypothetical protein